MSTDALSDVLSAVQLSGSVFFDRLRSRTRSTSTLAAGA
jgi:hypothetical protein